MNAPVRDKVRLLEDAVAKEDPPRAVLEWSRATRSLLAIGQQFRALSHDALAVLVRPAARTKYRLVLERPT